MRTSSLFVLLLAICSACSLGRHYRADPLAFIRMARHGADTIFSYQIIGVTNTHAYLSMHSGLPYLLGGGEDIYSVALSDLPARVAEQLRAGQGLEVAPAKYDLGHEWLLGHGDFGSVEEVRAALEATQRETAGPELGAVFLPYAEIELRYNWPPPTTVNYNDSCVTLKASSDDGFTPEDLVFKIHRATRHSFSAIDNVYLKGFVVTGGTSLWGRPFVHMGLGK